MSIRSWIEEKKADRRFRLLTNMVDSGSGPDALKALEQLAQEEAPAARALLGAVAGDTNRPLEVRATALQLCHGMGPWATDSMPGILEAYLNGPSDLRDSAAEIIGAFGTSDEIRKVLNGSSPSGKLVEKVFGRMNRPNKFVGDSRKDAEAMAEVLACVGTPKADDLLVRAAVREWSVPNVLFQAGTDCQPSYREALKVIQGPAFEDRLFPALRRCLADANCLTQQNIIDLIRKVASFGRTVNTDVPVSLLEVQDRSVVKGAADLCGQLKAWPAVEKLSCLAIHPGFADAPAMEALGQILGPDSAAAAVAAARRKYLQSLGPPEVLEVLLGEEATAAAVGRGLFRQGEGGAVLIRFGRDLNAILSSGHIALGGRVFCCCGQAKKFEMEYVGGYGGGRWDCDCKTQFLLGFGPEASSNPRGFFITIGWYDQRSAGVTLDSLNFAKGPNVTPSESDQNQPDCPAPDKAPEIRAGRPSVNALERKAPPASKRRHVNYNVGDSVFIINFSQKFNGRKGIIKIANPEYGYWVTLEGDNGETGPFGDRQLARSHPNNS